jgi:hypothetical protein
MKLNFPWFALAAALAVSPAAYCQSPQGANEAVETNTKAYVHLLRKDFKKEKAAITSEMMALSPEESAKFWPVYDAYDKELTKVGDEQLAFFRMYIENYATLTDQQATAIANGLLGALDKRNALQKKYFAKVSEALTPTLAARFVQIEHQLLLIMDLQIAATLPVVD